MWYKATLEAITQLFHESQVVIGRFPPHERIIWAYGEGLIYASECGLMLSICAGRPITE